MLATKRKFNGFVSIVTIVILLIVGSVIILTSYQINTDSFITNKNINAYFKSRTVAQSCMEIALNKLKINNSYSGNEQIQIGSDSCSIEPITGTGNTNRLVKVNSNILETNYSIEALVLEINPKIIFDYYIDGAD